LYFSETQTINANYHGKVFDISIIPITRIDLMDIQPENMKFMQKVLEIFNNIVKEALDQLDYKQIGKFPKFFNVKDKEDV